MVNNNLFGASDLAIEMSETIRQDSTFGYGPTGTGNYRVRQGDSIDSIAFRTGFFWESIWNRPENSELKDRRKNPDALLPGDRVFIPEKRRATESAATDQKHRFRRKGIPIKIDLLFLAEEDPIPATHYQLEIDGHLLSGTTTDGRIEHTIPPSARHARLILDDDGSAVVYQLQLGHIDSIEEVSGVQGRLNNLGYSCGPVDGKMNEQTVDAIRHFQQANELPQSDQLTQETVDKIEEQYGS
jgi:N-acetylmuramoyl-L-alanine amidase